VDQPACASHRGRRRWSSLISHVPCLRIVDKHRSALGTPYSALRTPHSALRTQHSALGPRHSALGPRHSALGTRHSALGPRHSALGPQPRPSHRQTDGIMSTPVRLERATEDSTTEAARSGAHAQFRRADDSAHIRSTRSLAAERGPEGCAEHPEPCSRRPRAAHLSFDTLPQTSPPLRTLAGVGGPMPVPPPSSPVLDSSVGSQCSPLRRTDFGDRRRCKRREIDRGWTLSAAPNFGGEYPALLLTAHTTSRSLKKVRGTESRRPPGRWNSAPRTVLVLRERQRIRMRINTASTVMPTISHSWSVISPARSSARPVAL